MADRTLMEAIQAYITSCKIAVDNALRLASSEEIEKSLRALEVANNMPTHPELFFEEQRKMFLCSSI